MVLTVACAQCGNDLEAEMTHDGTVHFIKVTPCETCIAEAETNSKGGSPVSPINQPAPDKGAKERD